MIVQVGLCQHQTWSKPKLLVFSCEGSHFIFQMRPVAEEFVGNYVKVIHDFHSGIPGELTLVQGDIFKVTSAVDKNWLHGKNREVEGNFPLDFVEKINIPSVDSHQKVFAATENFPAQQDGDLEFRKGITFKICFIYTSELMI